MPDAISLLCHARLRRYAKFIYAAHFAAAFYADDAIR